MKKSKPKSNGIKVWVIRVGLPVGIFAIVLLILYFAGRGPQNTSNFIGARKVTIKKENDRYRFYKDGKPFLVKGGAGFMFVKELAECGGNTIICWDTAKIENTLKEAAKYQVAVIIGLDIPGGDDVSFYRDEKSVAAFYKAYSRIVLRYKDHPSLLAWCLGNELVIPFSFTTLPFYKAYNRLLDMIHTSDPHHPVSTSTMNVAKRNIINLQWKVPALDFFCINTYNRLKEIHQDLQLIKLVWRGPYLIGEWAPNGGWEASVTGWKAPIENTSTKKAEQYSELYKKHMPLNDSRFLGSLAFYWGSRQEYTHTWYSVFNENGAPTEIKEVLNDCWKGTMTPHVAPKLQYMLIDSLGAQDNIIVSPGSTHRASVFLEKFVPSDSTLHYSWQILKEDWLYWGRTWRDFKKPPAEKGLLSDSALKYTSFKAPLREGPYRVYVTVYNSKGYCATANTPIYVVE